MLDRKNIISHKQALALKELGFESDGEVYQYYDKAGTPYEYFNWTCYVEQIFSAWAPTFIQVEDWLYDNTDVEIESEEYDSKLGTIYTGQVILYDHENGTSEKFDIPVFHERHDFYIAAVDKAIKLLRESKIRE